MHVDAMSSALQGLRRNQEDMARRAHRIAGWGDPDAASTRSGHDLAGDAAGILQSRRGYEANLAVVRVADEMLGTLLDILA